MSIIRLAFLYGLAGVGILYVQLANTPCRTPLVLDDGKGAVTAPIDLARLGTDRDYQWRVGSDVVFWLPRFIRFVAFGDVTVKDFLFATDCAGSGASSSRNASKPDERDEAPSGGRANGSTLPAAAN